jgi:hypothetical protein
MKNIMREDLPKLGVNPLTGEADAYCMRVLCDVNEDGAELFRRFFGLPYDVVLSKNMNSMVGYKPAIASVMLSRTAMWEMVKFALFAEGHDYVVEMDYQYIGLKADDEYTERYLKICEEAPDHYKLTRNPTAGSTQPRVGDRNIHTFTGRTL